MKQPIPDTGPDGLIHPDRLAELERTVRDARFGYAAVDGQRYARDVALLLEERRKLLPLPGSGGAPRGARIGVGRRGGTGR